MILLGAILAAIQVQGAVADVAAAPPSIQAPARIVIPALGVSAPVVPVGEDSAGRMGVPTNGQDVAWWSLGQSPGQSGGTVMAGHLDWYGPLNRQTGRPQIVPAVFSHLDQLKLGDLIQIDDLTGYDLVYHVVSVRSVPYNSDLADLFSPDGASIISLLTCAGAWDQAAGTYDRRTVVIARLDWRWLWTKKIEDSR
jgi:LPXTG-site transpeptidase (sortase) family protein